MCAKSDKKNIRRDTILLGNSCRSDRNRNKKHTHKDIRKIHSHNSTA